MKLIIKILLMSMVMGLGINQVYSVASDIEEFSDGGEFLIASASEEAVINQSLFMAWVDSIRNTTAYYVMSRVLGIVALTALLDHLFFLVCTDSASALYDTNICKTHVFLYHYISYFVASAGEFFVEHHDTVWSKMHDEL